MTWFYEKGGQQRGPVAVEKLLSLLDSNEITRDTLVWREGMADWQRIESAGLMTGESGEEMVVCAHSGAVRPKSEMIPYGSLWVLPEHRDAFVQNLMAGKMLESRGEGLVPDDYTVPIGECLSRGWQSLTADFWPNVGVAALLMSIYFAASMIPYLGSLAGFVQAPLFAGMFWYYLEKTRGRSVDVGAAFAGFSRNFLNLFLLGLVTGLLVMGTVIPGVIVAVLGGVVMESGGSSELGGGLMMVLGAILAIAPAIYFQVAWMFSTLLCIDRRMDFWPSMMTSLRTVNKHWLACFGFTLLIGLISLGGFMAACIGIFLAVPWVTLAMVHLYEHIFGRPRASEWLEG